MNTLPAHHLHSRITPADLQDFAHLVPPTGHDILRVLGDEAGLRLFNGLPGVRLLVPKGPCNNAGGARVWSYLSAIIGLEAMQALATARGGEGLIVPTLYVLRAARRKQAIRSEFDRLTASAGEGLSKAGALQVLCLTHAPISSTHLQTILDRPSLEPVCQNSLF